MKKITLLVLLSSILFCSDKLWAQAHYHEAPVSNFTVNSYTLPNGSVISGWVSLPNQKTNGNNKSQTGNCTTPKWSVSPSKTLNCNASCATLLVADSLNQTPMGHVVPGYGIDISGLDGNQCNENRIEIWIDGVEAVAIGNSAGSCTGSCQYLGTMSAWFGASICSSGGVATIHGQYLTPTNQVEVRVYDSGQSGTYSWKLYDLATAGVVATGTWDFPTIGAGYGSTGTFSKSTGINKGSATFTCASCPPGALTDYKNGFAVFCPQTAGVKPGNYVVKYDWNDGIGCASTYTDTITVLSIYKTTWVPPANICASSSSVSLNSYLDPLSQNTGTWSGSGVSGGNWNTTGLSGPITLTYTLGAGTTCESKESHTITVNPKPTAAITSKSPLSGCSGGALNVVLNGAGAGAGGSYTWSTGASTDSISVTSVGTYTVTVTNSNNCTSVSTVNISTNPAPSVSTSGVTDVKCKGGSTGGATLNVTSGTPSYTYAWSNSTTGNSLQGVATGTYSVTVTDSKGCTGVTTITVNEPATSVTLPAPTATSTGCGSNSATGTASASGTGGTGVLTYTWNPGNKTGASISGLQAGTFTVTVTDANGCTATGSATVNPPAGGPTVSTSQTDVKCNGDLTGSAYSSATGGSGSYSISWSTGPTSANITNVGSGSYIVTYTDLSNSCSNSKTVTINQPAAYNMNPVGVNLKCNNDKTGSISITPTGNTGPYQYDWSPINKTTEDVSNLAAGTYVLSITDAKGCTATFSYSITQPTAIAITASVTNSTCGKSNGSIVGAGTGGTGTLTYGWSSGSTGSSLNGLTAGTYTLTVTDASGCTATTTAVVGNSSGISASTTSTNASCGNTNGTASVVLGGGVTPYTYSWSPSGGSSSNASNLAPGIYSVLVTDATGCSSTQTVTVGSTPGPTADFKLNPPTGPGPLLVSFKDSTAGSISWLWSFGDPTSSQNTSTLSNPKHTYDKDGTYTACLVAITGSGCGDSVCKKIVVEGKLLVIFPNIFSPNGDGVNDTYKIKTTGVEKLDITIYDRWGLLISSTNGALPDSKGYVATWDGKTNTGSSATDGTYYYLAKVYGLDTKTYDYNGFITLVK